MAHRENHDQQHSILYTTVMPANTKTNENSQNESSVNWKRTELERAKAVRAFVI